MLYLFNCIITPSFNNNDKPYLLIPLENKDGTKSISTSRYMYFILSTF